PLRLVGAAPSRPALVERRHAQASASYRRHWPLRAGAPPDLHRPLSGASRLGARARNRARRARRRWNGARLVFEGAGRGTVPARGARRRGLQRLCPPRADAGAVRAALRVQPVQPRSARTARGDKPKRVLKARLKWALSLKPQRNAISVTERARWRGSSRSARHRSSRPRRIAAATESP